MVPLSLSVTVSGLELAVWARLALDWPSPYFSPSSAKVIGAVCIHVWFVSLRVMQEDALNISGVSSRKPWVLHSNRQGQAVLQNEGVCRAPAIQAVASFSASTTARHKSPF